MILWNQSVFLENLFKEYKISCRTAMPDSLNTPHIGTAKMVLIPAGFLSEYADSDFKSSLFKEKTVKKLLAFVENGGKLLIFSPLKDSDFSWLNCGFPIFYRKEDITVSKKTQLVNQDEFFCDGFFEIPGNLTKFPLSVIETDNSNRPVHISISFGKGEIILSSIHEFLSKEYFESVLAHPEVKI
ncbi:hypothetical protein [Methanolapillus millepedarum]|uniref:Uncharacterized protein n=1 Tax=Methanolapillus millepedarum TaxID=3028296 RepID=A0AA96V5Y9_9EURY|nr:hypothetical protein MsAc7_12560 [Methanosarcinaceae archaeon Ac7]